MFVAVNPFISLFRKRLRCGARAALACGIVQLTAAASATGLTVLMSDDLAAHSEFVQHLRAGQEPGGRFDLVRLPQGSADTSQAVEAAAAEPDRGANAGVRTTRSRPPPSATPSCPRLRHHARREEECSWCRSIPASPAGGLLRPPEDHQGC